MEIRGYKININMKYFKNIVTGLLLSLLILGSTIENTKAQSLAGESLYSVNIYNAEVSPVETPNSGVSTVVFSFEIHNRKGVLPGLNYAVILVDKNFVEKTDYRIIDKKIYNEDLTLYPNDLVEIKDSYELPNYLKGNYILKVLLINENGFEIFASNLGEINLDQESHYINLKNNSCYLFKEEEGGSVHYDINQSVNVSLAETLFIACNAVNYFVGDKEIIPEFQFYNYSKYTKPLTADYLKDDFNQPLDIKEGEEKELVFKIPNLENTGLIEGELVLEDSQGKAVSNPLYFNLNLKSADKKNVLINYLSLNRDYFQANDEVEINLGLSAPDLKEELATADSGKTLNLEVIVEDEKGNPCTESFKQGLDLKNQGNLLFNLKNKSLVDCKNPKIMALVQENGKNLINKEVAIQSKNISDKTKSGTLGSNQGDLITGTENNNNKPGISFNNIFIYIIAGLFGLIILALIITFFINKSKQPKDNFLLYFLFVFLSGFLFVNQVKAESFYYPQNSIVSLGIDKFVYEANEKITLTGLNINDFNNNLNQEVEIFARVDIESSFSPQKDEQINGSYTDALGDWNNVFKGSLKKVKTLDEIEFIAPDIPGKHRLVFKIHHFNKQENAWSDGKNLGSNIYNYYYLDFIIADSEICEASVNETSNQGCLFGEVYNLEKQGSTFSWQCKILLSTGEGMVYPIKDVCEGSQAEAAASTSEDAITDQPTGDLAKAVCPKNLTFESELDETRACHQGEPVHVKKEGSKIYYRCKTDPANPGSIFPKYPDACEASLTINEEETLAAADDSGSESEDGFTISEEEPEEDVASDQEEEGLDNRVLCNEITGNFKSEDDLFNNGLNQNWDNGCKNGQMKQGDPFKEEGLFKWTCVDDNFNPTMFSATCVAYQESDSLLASNDLFNPAFLSEPIIMEPEPEEPESPEQPTAEQPEITEPVAEPEIGEQPEEEQPVEEQPGEPEPVEEQPEEQVGEEEPIEEQPEPEPEPIPEEAQSDAACPEIKGGPHASILDLIQKEFGNNLNNACINSEMISTSITMTDDGEEWIWLCDKIGICSAKKLTQADEDQRGDEDEDDEEGDEQDDEDDTGDDDEQEDVACSQSIEDKKYEKIEALLKDLGKESEPKWKEACSKGEMVIGSVEEDGDNWRWECGDEKVNPDESVTCKADKQTENQTIAAPECGTSSGVDPISWPPGEPCKANASVIENFLEGNTYVWKCQSKEDSSLKSPKCSAPVQRNIIYVGGGGQSQNNNQPPIVDKPQCNRDLATIQTNSVEEIRNQVLEGGCINGNLDLSYANPVVGTENKWKWRCEKNGVKSEVCQASKILDKIVDDFSINFNNSKISSEIKITGINTAVIVKIVGDISYSINNQEFTKNTSLVNNNDVIKIKIDDNYNLESTNKIFIGEISKEVNLEDLNLNTTGQGNQEKEHDYTNLELIQKKQRGEVSDELIENLCPLGYRVVNFKIETNQEQEEVWKWDCAKI
jgi:hypothetical protein